MPAAKAESAWLIIFAVGAIIVHQVAVHTLARVGEQDSAEVVDEEIGTRNLEADFLAVADRFPTAARGTERIALTNESAVVGVLDPFTTLAEKESGVRTYKIKRGDTLERVAKQFGISVETIKSANPSTNSKLIPGRTLTILPVTGILYPVSENDTLQLIAGRYNVDPNLVKIYNPSYIDILVSGRGTLILPNAAVPAVSQKPAK